MGDLFVFDSLIINSHRGQYRVKFSQNAFADLVSDSNENKHFLIDANIASLYGTSLAPILKNSSTLIIEATEAAKSLDRFTGYVENLVDKEVRRDHLIVAIGGGIIQDIAAFLASTFLRGIKWEFYPTTLLAQADSCIGSKSSINVGNIKNILGTYRPPESITIDPEILKTLSEFDMRSGIGEMLKVHAIKGVAYFDEICSDYENLLENKELLIKYIYQSLNIKKTIIELDEFDTGIRNVMNYGHSFGHAIEAATNFAVPHGIAVTIGMDIANYVAVQLGRVSQDHFDRMHLILMKNSNGYHSIKVPLDDFFSALGKDKKNIGSKLSLILPDANGVPQRTIIDNSKEFTNFCAKYFSSILLNGKKFN